MGKQCLGVFLVVFLALSVKTSKGHNNNNNNNNNDDDDDDDEGMVKINGTQLIFNGTRFHVNGFKAYWPLFDAAEPSKRGKVGAAFEEARNHGLNVLRTLAFGEGGKNHPPLQIKPGDYNETMFQALDYVIWAAGKEEMKVILSLADNWKDYGGMPQYMEWVHGKNNLSAELFFSDYQVKQHYKNHVKAVLTRKNNITGVRYKDDPTIMAWELINEPRCKSDLSGNTLQKWIEEMANFTKSIDKKHLVEIGLEGFYGQQSPQKNLGSNDAFHQFGADFIRNNQIPGIDFATVHAYPDAWLSSKSEEEQLLFLKTWIDGHIEDAQKILKKPILVAEFGKNSKDTGFSVDKRDKVFTTVYTAISNSTRVGGAAAGGLFWQLSMDGMDDSFYDGYHIILNQNPSTAKVIKQQSSRLGTLRPKNMKKNMAGENNNGN